MTLMAAVETICYGGVSKDKSGDKVDAISSVFNVVLATPLSKISGTDRTRSPWFRP